MKSKFITAFMAIIIAVAGKAQPPNNPIFFGSRGDGFSAVKNGSASNAIFVGGMGDGFSRGTNGVNSNDIFKGGRGDGFNFSSNNVASNTIFFGGNGDGWNKAANAAPSNNIFIGGNGDGWNKNGNAAPPNVIFIGGNGDGWNKSGNAAPSNNIFIGGNGDGWSKVVFPLGPLPVSLLSFTGEQINKQHLLKWQTTNEINAQNFELQRSITGNDFKSLGSLQAVGQNGTSVNNYSFVDAQPLQGNNFYRLKQIDIDGKFIYSNIILLRVLKDKAVLSVYPNPTADFLNIALIGQSTTANVQIEVYDMNGRKVNSATNKNGNSVVRINVSTLAKGFYTLFINDNGEISSIKFVKQ